MKKAILFTLIFISLTFISLAQIQNNHKNCEVYGVCLDDELDSHIEIINNLIAMNRPTDVIPTHPLSMWGNSNFTGSLILGGGLQLSTETTKPSCNEQNRGKMWHSHGGLGVADILELCRKTALNTYVWAIVGLT